MANAAMAKSTPFSAESRLMQVICTGPSAGGAGASPGGGETRLGDHEHLFRGGAQGQGVLRGGGREDHDAVHQIVAPTEESTFGGLVARAARQIRGDVLVARWRIRAEIHGGGISSIPDHQPQRVDSSVGARLLGSGGFRVAPPSE
ncbi:MAG TPA: hypothetical protein VEX86_03245 [Longimicrobium sp.]|nr:hypothetical protein [Longimicrobium sp.]